MDQVLVEAFRYNKWANLHLLDVCAGLTDAQLELASPGTYGSIAATWMHLLAGEQRYLARLSGTKAQLNEKQGFPGIAALKAHAERSGEDLLDAAVRLAPDAAMEGTGDEGPYRLSLWVVAVQAIHHGTDHRTHICTILGQNGIEYPQMDVWAYGEAAGGIVSLERR